MHKKDHPGPETFLARCVDRAFFTAALHGGLLGLQLLAWLTVADVAFGLPGLQLLTSRLVGSRSRVQMGPLVCPPPPPPTPRWGDSDKLIVVWVFAPQLCCCTGQCVSSRGGHHHPTRTALSSVCTRLHGSDEVLWDSCFRGGRKEPTPKPSQAQPNHRSGSS